MNKIGMAFGSYGWAKKGGATDVLDCLKEMNCELVVEEALQCQFVPTKEVLKEARGLGEKLAQKALELGS